MMILLLAAAQSAGAAQLPRDLRSLLQTSEEVMRMGYECMDKHMKLEMLRQSADATPESVADAAIDVCSHLKKTYATAVAPLGGAISQTAGQELADDWLASLRDTYVKHVDGVFAKPAMAEARWKVAALQWAACAKEKAKDWSRLDEGAATIARAAVGSCSSHYSNYRRALEYSLRSRDFPPSAAADSASGTRDELIDIALQTVVAERASRLPQQ